MKNVVNCYKEVQENQDKIFHNFTVTNRAVDLSPHYFIF